MENKAFRQTDYIKWGLLEDQSRKFVAPQLRNSGNLTMHGSVKLKWERRVHRNLGTLVRSACLHFRGQENTAESRHNSCITNIVISPLWKKELSSLTSVPKTIIHFTNFVPLLVRGNTEEFTGKESNLWAFGKVVNSNARNKHPNINHFVNGKLVVQQHRNYSRVTLELRYSFLINY